MKKKGALKLNSIVILVLTFVTIIFFMFVIYPLVRGILKQP
jgi:hypothetical protein